MSLTYEDFNDYHMVIYNPYEQPVTPSARSKKTTSLPTKHQPADDFKKNIKRDKTHYDVLKEDKQWDN